MVLSDGCGGEVYSETDDAAWRGGDCCCWSLSAVINGELVACSSPFRLTVVPLPFDDPAALALPPVSFRGEPRLSGLDELK